MQLEPHLIRFFSVLLLVGGLGAWFWLLPALPPLLISESVRPPSPLVCPDTPSLTRHWSPERLVAQRIVAYVPPGSRLNVWALGLGGLMVNRAHGPDSPSFRRHAEPYALEPLPGVVLPLIAIDQEGGVVTRLEEASLERFPPNARLLNAATVSRQGRVYGETLLRAGISVNFAPVVDVASVQGDVIGSLGRAYSSNPATVASLAREFVLASQAQGVAPTLKHFPGHGMVTEDSHLVLPVTRLSEEELWETHLLPYRQLFADARVRQDMLLVMTAHVRFDSLDASAPASLSRAVTTDLLRERLGYEGVIITDALGMGALTGSVRERVLRALHAGADFVLLEPGLEGELERVIAAILEDFGEDKAKWAENEAALRRIFRLKAALGLLRLPEGCSLP